MKNSTWYQKTEITLSNFNVCLIQGPKENTKKKTQKKTLNK